MAVRLIGVVGGIPKTWALEPDPSGGTTLEVGRSSRCPISLSDGTVSKSHAEFTLLNGRWMVRDLGSRNGTRVNGMPVEAPTPVNVGDRVEFGHIALQLADVDPLASAFPQEMTESRSSLQISAQQILNSNLPGRSTEGRLLSLLARAGHLLILPQAMKETCEKILELVEEAVPATRLVMMLRTGTDGELKPIAVRQRGGGGSVQPLAISRTIMDMVLTENTSVLTTDATADPRFKEQLSIVAQSVHSALAVPLFDNEKVLGLLYADSNFPGLSYNQSQLEILTLLANMAAVKISNARLLEAEQTRLRIQQELATAVEIQRALLPAAAPSVLGYECLARLESCFEVGGDLYDFQAGPDGSLLIVQGDVTGKGMGAALLMSSFMASARVLLDSEPALDKVAAKLNAIILRSTDPMHFVTAFLGRLDPTTGRLQYVNAAHPPPLLFDARGCTALPTTGPAIGMFPHLPFEVAEVALEPGALLAVFTDGIPEARRSRDDAFFDDERVVAAVSAVRENPRLESIADHLIRQVDEFLAGEARSDDITLTLLRRGR